MDYQNFQDVWMEVGCFIRELGDVYGTPQVKIYSEYIDVLFTVDSISDEWIPGGNKRTIYTDDEQLVLRYRWYFNPQK